MTRRPTPLYERLPEIHRTRDAEGTPDGQLQAFVGLIDEVFRALHDDVRALYDDLFLDSAADWAVPYIGDLLGTSHLAGDPWTIRADVADTIALRRRKGTLAGIERLTYDLTGWGVHAVELRDRLRWNQHPGHIRPDGGGDGGVEPPGRRLTAPTRGGTVTLRDPGVLGLIGTPFDPFAHLPDVRPPAPGGTRYNLPNLAIQLWRLAAYSIPPVRPGRIEAAAVTPGPAPAPGSPVPPAPAASHVVRVTIDPLARPLRLFGRGASGPESLAVCCGDGAASMPVLAGIDDVPGPIPRARLTSGTWAGNPGAYVAVVADGEGARPADGPALTIVVPAAVADRATWRFRGANLCAWEPGLDAPVRVDEVVIDPVIGRVVVGAASAAEAASLVRRMRVSYTYGTVGPVGAHPIDRPAPPASWDGEPFAVARHAAASPASRRLRRQLRDLQTMSAPLVIELDDSEVHDLDLAAVAGTVTEDGGPTLALSRTLVIRAADGQRPVVRLTQPLRVRAATVRAASPADQPALDRRTQALTLRLEGLILTRGPAFPAGEPLIARAGIGHLELDGCTLDPGGHRRLDLTREPTLPSVRVVAGHGYTGDEAAAFAATPVIVVTRSITGPLLLDDACELTLRASIVDGGAGPGEAPTQPAIASASDPAAGWSAPITIDGATILGPVRTTRIDGEGGIFAHALAVEDNQHGCVRLSWFADAANRLPPTIECVSGRDARLRFVSIDPGDPAYCQLTRSTDFRVLERGPRDDEMGAFGFLREAHKWRNLQIRYREFMPLGIRPLLIPAT